MGEQVKLGSKVKDSATGFEGVVTARCEYLSQAPRLLVESGFDGKRHEEWFDEGRLAVIAA